MKRILTIAISILFSVHLNSFSQELATESPITYVYQPSETEILKILKKGTDAIDVSMLHTLIDTIPTSKTPTEYLIPGNYLIAKVTDRFFDIQLLQIHRFIPHIHQNNYNLKIEITDIDGKSINDAKVKVGGHIIKYDKVLNQYFSKNSRNDKFLTIEKNGSKEYFHLIKTNNRNRFSWNRIHYTAPIRVFWRPFQDIYRSFRWGEPYGWVDQVTRPFVKSDFNGFVVFSKPIYKPGDTIKVKGYITNKNGKPIKQDLSVYLITKNKYQKLTDLTAYGLGGYEYKFLIPDSLDVKLDQRIGIKFTNQKGRSISGFFSYQEYELAKTEFRLSSEYENQYREENLILSLEAKDENNLYAHGSEAVIRVFPEQIRDFKDSLQTIPNTLLEDTIKLSTNSTTEYIIQDSLFHNFNLSYKVDVDFKDADGHVQKESLYIKYYDQPIRLNIDLEADSIKFSALREGKPISLEVEVDTDFTEDLWKTEKVSLPFSKKFNQNAQSYWLQYNEQYKSEYVTDWEHEITCECLRTTDSIYFKINNPHDINLSYEVFKQNKKIDFGSDYKNISSIKSDKGSYFLRVNFIWGDENIKKECRTDYYESNLQFIAELPNVIVPGQEVEVALKVTDQKGRPVQNADITALGFTTKFEEDNIPEVPYFGKSKKRQKHKRSFGINSPIIDKSRKSLNYDSLKNEYGLDSMAYFQFLYPEKGFYKKEIPIESNLTEFSIYYSENGKVIHPEILYLDGTPIYYKQTNQSHSRYVFNASPGKHTIKLRTARKIILFKDVTLRSSKKSIIHLTSESAKYFKKISITEAEDELEYNERQQLWRHLFKVHLGRNSEAIITGGNKLQFLKTKKYQSRTMLVGPIRNSMFHYDQPLSFKDYIDLEPGYTYHIDSHRTIMKSYNSIRTLKQRLIEQPMNVANSIYDRILTRQEIDSIIHEDRIMNHEKSFVGYDQGEISIASIEVKNFKGIILYNSEDPNTFNIYPRSTKSFNHLPAGQYRMIFLLKNNRHFQIDGIPVSDSIKSYVNPNKFTPQKNDAEMDSIDNYFDQYLINQDYVFIKNSFKNSMRSELINRYSDVFGDLREITGIIYDQSGNALPGVNVIIKGTTRGTTSDINGSYTIYVEEGQQLEFSFIGIKTESRTVGNQSIINMYMDEDAETLSEVVVTAQGYSVNRQSLSYSITSVNRELAGKVAGVEISDGEMKLLIRGNSLLSGDDQPIYVVDGVIYNTIPESIDPSNILETSVLKGEAAQAIYGSKAANGIVVITTKTGAKKRKLIPSNDSLSKIGKIRSNFNDEALWEPKLKTDKNGFVRFTQKFPEDITSWQLHFLGAHKKKLTGYSNATIKTFQPVNATLIVPNFLVEDDKINLRGKVSNYTADSIDVAGIFKITNEQEVAKGKVGDFRIDEYTHQVIKTDSLKVTYKVEYNNNFEGEQRTIPIRKKGIKEYFGTFLELSPDSTYLIEIDTAHEVRFYNHPIENLRNDLLSLTDYAYNCNEQMASKLMAWLYLQEASNLLNQPTKDHSVKVKKIIKKLLSNRNDDGLWGWWGKSNSNWWISKHTLEALITAKNRGYSVALFEDQLNDFLLWKFESETDQNRLYIAEMLELLNNQEVNMKLELSKINYDSLNTNEKFRLTKLSLTTDSIIGLNEMVSTVSQNPFGGYWWGNENPRHIENNTITNTAMAIEILSTLDTLEEVQKGAISYLLSKKSSRGFRNTYESVTTINQMMKYFIKYFKTGKPEVTIKSKITTKHIAKFPYNNVLTSGKYEITNSGGGQIFGTYFKSHWNKSPIKIDSLIEIQTFLPELKLGEENIFRINIKTKHSLEYVMVSVPIPAGCSFQEKPLYVYGANHVEYYYDKVNLYFDYLGVGEKLIEFKLNPRFSGSFNLNPAVVELMYFPTYFGRESIKRIIIRD